MTEKHRVGDLEIETDPDFLRRQWRVERAGWVIMSLLILAALAGAFGGGPLARAETESRAEAMRVEYDRIARRRGDGALDFHLAAAAVGDTVARLWLEREYVEQVGIQRVTPEPASVVSDGGRLVYEFDVQPQRPSRVVMEFEPRAMGSVGGWAGLVGGDSVSLSHFLLP